MHYSKGRSMKTSCVFFLFSLTLLTGCLGGGAPKNLPPRTAFISTKTASSVGSEIHHIGPQELQAAVMAFADTTNARLSQAADIIERIGTPQARLTAANMMVFDVGSNVEIAAGPYPGIALLDMVVITSLRRMVWEDFWIPKKFGEAGAPALEIFRDTEQDIWELAARIMNPEQLDELASVILRWRKKNVKQVSINYVRFDDFGELGLKPSMRKLITPGGLFASVKEATMIAQDMKVSIDRAFYLMSRMQLIINFQIKLAYLQIVFQPEANGLIDTSQKMAGITERYAEIAENLPDKISDELAGLINLMSANLTKNTTQTLNGIEHWQTQAIKDIMVNVSAEREAAINQTLNGLLKQQEGLFTQVDKLVDQSGDTMEKAINHAFLLGALLVTFFFVLLSLYKVFIAKPAGRRTPPE